MEEASKSQRRPTLPATETDVVRTELPTGASLARRPISRANNAKPAVSSDTNTIRRCASKGIKRRHKVLLVPLTAVEYQEHLCCGCCKNGKAIRLDDKIEDIVRAEATIAEAMEHLEPVVQKGRPTKIQESICCGWCCCEKNAHPGYDFLFNRQKFKSLLVIQLAMFFLAIIILNHEKYMLKAPSCNPVQLDNFRGSRSRRIDETAFNLNYVKSSVTLYSHEKIFIVPQTQEFCHEMIKPLDAFGFCTIVAQIEWAPAKDSVWEPDPLKGLITVALLGYGVALISLSMGRKLSYDYKAGKRSPVRRRCTWLVRVYSAILNLISVLSVSKVLHGFLRVCNQGLFNNDCFLQNGTVVSTKKQATSYYQGYQYLSYREHEKIKVAAAGSSNASLTYTTGVLNSLKPVMELMEINFSNCLEFQYDGDLLIMYGIWLALTVFFYISVVSMLISTIEYLKPGFTIHVKRKIAQFKDAAFKNSNTTAKVKGLLFKIKRGLPTACKGKGSSLTKELNVPVQKRKKLDFQFPPIVGAAVILTVLGLVGIFAQYWVWQDQMVCGFLEKCVVRGLERAHSIAKDPKVTNSSQMLYQLLDPCAPYMDYADVEHELSSLKRSFFREFSGAVSNLSAIGKLKLDELRASAVSHANAVSPDAFAQIINFGTSAGATTYGIGTGFAGFMIKSTQSSMQKFADANFLELKRILANDVIGKIILGQVVAQAILIGAQIGKIILIVCAVLRVRSIQRMLNKMYVIGVRQCEVVERCFMHEEGTYVVPMNSQDIDGLRGYAPQSKILTNNFEICGAEVRMPHREFETLSEDEKREAQEKRLEYRHIHDVNYFLPGFVVSQLMGSIIQFWLLYGVVLFLYIGGAVMVVYTIVRKPAHEGGGVRAFNAEEDISKGFKVLSGKITTLFVAAAIPFFLKKVVLKQCGKYSADRNNGIKAPKRFILINFIQMVSCYYLFLYGQVLCEVLLELTKLLCFFLYLQIYLIPITFVVMISRVAAAVGRSLYLLGDLDKPFGYFDTLTYGWNSIIESMRIRAEFRKKAYHKAKEIRGGNGKVKDDEALLEALLGEGRVVKNRFRNSWVMMTPSVAKGIGEGFR